MLVLSIDASTKASGYAIFKDKKLIKSGIVTATSTEVFKRIDKMVTEFTKIIETEKPDKIVMEEVLPEDVNNNQKTFKALIYLQAFLAKVFTEKNIPYEFIVPSHWRKLCGIKTGAGVHRDSLKAESIKFVNEHYNIKVNDDIADAICLGYSYSNAPVTVTKKTIDDVKKNGFNW